MTTRAAPMPAQMWPPRWQREPRSWLRCAQCGKPQRFENMVDKGGGGFVCGPAVQSDLCRREGERGAA
jgi:hypothetical protein